MAATVIDSMADHWAESKPADYKGQDLDKALKAYEALESKMPTIPSNLIPSIPESKVSAIDECIANVKSTIAELEKGKTYLNQLITAAKAVQTAASKTSADLTKLAKGKKDAKEELKYKNAASTANFIGSSAAQSMKQCKGS